MIVKFAKEVTQAKHNVNQNMKIHDESKAFKCDVCLKVFVSKSHLNRHHRIHIGEKPLLVNFVIENLLEKVI